MHELFSFDIYSYKPLCNTDEIRVLSCRAASSSFSSNFNEIFAQRASLAFLTLIIPRASISEHMEKNSD